MYAVPVIVLVILIAIGAAWSPIFAAIIAVPLFVAFLAFVGFSRRADETEDPQEGIPNVTEDKAPERAGMWGEKEA
jgi:hypothetical protein